MVAPVSTSAAPEAEGGIGEPALVSTVATMGGTCTSMTRNAPTNTSASASPLPPDVGEVRKWLWTGTDHADGQRGHLRRGVRINDLSDEERLVAHPGHSRLKRFIEQREGAQKLIAVDQRKLPTVVFEKFVLMGVEIRRFL